MAGDKPSGARRLATSAEIQRRVQAGGERVWSFEELAGARPLAAAQALSRLVARGELQRIQRGLYYRPRPSRYGVSRPDPGVLLRIAQRSRSLFPAGGSAAVRLGYSTQVPARPELSTTASSVPRRLVGPRALVHVRRPAAWASLSEEEGALLELLRERAASSELSEEQTLTRTLGLLGVPRRLSRLLEAARTEPPRVRALLGALAETLGARPRTLASLRASLHPLSRFDFGCFRRLPSARAWQAKAV
jgi:hypothetical protein